MKTFSILAALCCLFGCSTHKTTYQSLSADDYEKAIADPAVVRLDVRTAEEYAESHIEGAINLDVKNADFGSMAEATLPKDKLIAVNCLGGKRSKAAAEILTGKGFKVIELDPGYKGWTDAGKAVTREEADLFRTPGGTLIYMYCIKHGSVKMRIGDKWLYVDPVTDRAKPLTDYSGMPKADIILITHEHGDHLDAKAIAQLTKQGTIVIANPSSSEQLGGKTEVMANGDSKTIGNMQIEAVPAYNSSADKQQFHPKGRDNGYVLTIDGFRIYLAGDTEDIDEMRNLSNIDVAFLPCNLPYTMTPEQAANAARLVKPRVLFPYHYGQTEIGRVAELLQGSGIEVRIRQYQ